MEVTEQTLAQLQRLPKARRKKEYAQIGATEWKKCSEDIFYWLDSSRHPVLGSYVYTRDPHPMYRCLLCAEDNSHHMADREKHLKLAHKIEATSEADTRGYYIELDPYRPFPLQLPYVRPIVETWLKKPIMFIEKSRDMVATWTVVMCYTWDTLFHKGRENIFQSEDAAKTLDLVERAYFIYSNQPKFLRNVFKATFTVGQSRSGRMVVPELNSIVLGFPQGPDQIRQYHPSGVFQDEAAFQEAAGDAFAAIKPAIQNGGRFTAVSSPYPGWFMHAAKDTLDTLAL